MYVLKISRAIKRQKKEEEKARFSSNPARALATGARWECFSFERVEDRDLWLEFNPAPSTPHAYTHHKHEEDDPAIRLLQLQRKKGVRSVMVVPVYVTSAATAQSACRRRSSLRRIQLLTLVGLFGAGSIVALALPSSSTSVSTGLQNLGNTCYMNAQLQCAYHIPLVKRLVLEGAEGDDCTTAATSRDADDDDDETVATAVESFSSFSTEEEEDTEIITQQTKRVQQPKEESIALLSLRQVFQEMEDRTTTNRAAASPRVLCRNLGIPVWEQQDSQEFWKLLLPALQFKALRDLYAGSYEDYLVALDGSGRERRRPEAFWDLSLDLLDTTSATRSSSGPAKNSVASSLRALFGTPERLSAREGNGWRPSRGQDPVDAHKGSRLMAAGLPPILQLHLKRFHFDWNTETTTKLNHPLEFSQTLDLSDLVQDEQADGENDERLSCRYELQSVVVHVGEFGSGHYYAYVRPDVRQPDWYRFNDDIVQSVSWDEVVRDAYGGKFSAPAAAKDDTTKEDENAKSQKREGCFVRRFIRGIFGQGNSSGSQDDPYGYGGPTSNAYVLQYVRQCDIPRLYNVVDE